MEIPQYLPYFEKFKCPICKGNIALWYISNNRELNCPSCEVSLSSNYKEASRRAYNLGVPIFLVSILAELILGFTNLIWLKVIIAFGGIISFYLGYLVFLRAFKIIKV